MVKTGSTTPNRAIICREAATEWKNIKSKSDTEIDNMIKEYMITPINPYIIPIIRSNLSNNIVKPTSSTSPLPIINLVESTIEISRNAMAQRKILEEIKTSENKLAELKQIYNITTDVQIQHDVYAKIEQAESEISSNKDKIDRLKRNARYVQNCRAKKLKILTENKEVIQYDKSGRPIDALRNLSKIISSYLLLCF